MVIIRSPISLKNGWHKMKYRSGFRLFYATVLKAKRQSGAKIERSIFVVTDLYTPST